VQVDPRLTPVWPRITCAWFCRLNLQYDEPLSNFAFNFNLCPNTEEEKASYNNLYAQEQRASPRRIEELMELVLVAVGPGGCCPPPHQMHFDPSFLEFYDILLRGEQHLPGLGGATSSTCLRPSSLEFNGIL